MAEKLSVLNGTFPSMSQSVLTLNSSLGDISCFDFLSECPKEAPEVPNQNDSVEQRVAAMFSSQTSQQSQTEVASSCASSLTRSQQGANHLAGLFSPVSKPNDVPALPESPSHTAAATVKAVDHRARRVRRPLMASFSSHSKRSRTEQWLSQTSSNISKYCNLDLENGCENSITQSNVKCVGKENVQQQRTSPEEFSFRNAQTNISTLFGDVGVYNFVAAISDPFQKPSRGSVTGKTRTVATKVVLSNGGLVGTFQVIAEKSPTKRKLCV